MTLQELYNQWPALVEAEYYQIDKAKQHAQSLKEAAETEDLKKQADELLDNIDRRRELVEKIKVRLHHELKQLALYCHVWHEPEGK